MMKLWTLSLLALLVVNVIADFPKKHSCRKVAGNGKIRKPQGLGYTSFRNYINWKCVFEPGFLFMVNGCADYANKNGWSWFGIEYWGECNGGDTAELNYVLEKNPDSQSCAMSPDGRVGKQSEMVIYTCTKVGGCDIDSSGIYEGRMPKEVHAYTKLNECAKKKDNCDRVNGGCVDECFGFKCTCKAGYRLENDGKTCTDIDECAENTDGCDDANGKCVNEPGSFTCECNDGYKLAADGKTCEDIDECAENTDGCDDANGKCVNEPGSFTCECNDGYKLAADEKTCEDIDECAEGTDGCDTGNGKCVNQPGGFKCECKDGFKLAADGKTCKDIDECAKGTHGCDTTNGKCVNEPGSFKCECNDGFELAVDGKTCEKNNPCAGNHGCDAVNGRCVKDVNAPQGFHCECNDGFELAADGKTCKDIDECTKGTHKCTMNIGICVNTPGSYECKCKPGYILAGDGRTCTFRCKNNLDIGLIIDSSTSIEDQDFVTLKEFLTIFTKCFVVSRTNCAFSLERFTDKADLLFKFNTYNNQNDVIAAYNKFQRIQGRTDGAYALAYANHALFKTYAGKRDTVKSVALMITDGRFRYSAKKQANALKNRGIHVIAVGMSDKIDEGQLKEIVNVPDKDFFHFPKWMDLVVRVYEVANRACEAL